MWSWIITFSGKELHVCHESHGIDYFFLMMFPHDGKIVTVDQRTYHDPQRPNAPTNVNPIVDTSLNNTTTPSLLEVGLGLFVDTSMKDSFPLVQPPMELSDTVDCACSLLPPKLYLVDSDQVSLVNRTKIFCSDFKRPSEVLLGSACCTISYVHTPWGNCNKCSSMIVSIKDSVS